MPIDGTLNDLSESSENPMSDDAGLDLGSKGQNVNLVYDFLYQDVRRVASFLAQFEEHGVRSSVKATEAVGQSEASKSSVTGSAGIPTLLGASGVLDVTATSETKDLAEHTFDPLWSNSRRLLDYLAENDLLKTNLFSAPIGSFIKISGSVAIVDIKMAADVLKDAALRKIVLDEFSREADLLRDGPEITNLDQSLDLVLTMPTSIQLHVFGKVASAWGCLTNESLVTSASELSYKHGPLLRGFWTAIGILDAIPDAKRPITEDEPNPRTLGDYAEEMVEGAMANIAARISNRARLAMGRPVGMFGISPLLILREVGRPPEPS